MGSAFVGVRVLDCPDCPEFHVNGTRRLELRADGRVALWQCEDFQSDDGAPSAFCVPRVKLLVPVRNFIWNTFAVAQWAADKGLISIPSLGPGAADILGGRMH